jgi:hypothetical protein
LPTGPLFRPEAERFRQQRHLGTMVLFRPVSLRWLTLLPLAIVAVLLLGASRLAVRPRFAGVAEAAGDRRVTVVVEPRASTIRPLDRVTLELPAGGAPVSVQGTVATVAADDCRSGVPRAFLPAGPRSARCIALGIDLDASLDTARAGRSAPDRVEVAGPPRTYLSYLLDW